MADLFWSCGILAFIVVSCYEVVSQVHSLLSLLLKLSYSGVQCFLLFWSCVTVVLILVSCIEVVLQWHSLFSCFAFKENPQQMNGGDCGMFMCMYAEFITRGKEITFTQVGDVQFFKNPPYIMTFVLASFMSISENPVTPSHPFFGASWWVISIHVGNQHAYSECLWALNTESSRLGC